MKNYYEVLGVEKDAPLDQIKKAYRKLVRKYHPDMGETSDLERFLEIQKAFEVLSNEERRAEYDRGLAESAEAVAPEQLLRRERFADWLWEDWFPAAFPFRRFAPYASDTGGLLEVILSPLEIKTRKFVTVEIPFEMVCPNCRGEGTRGLFICDSCLGKGTVTREITVNLPIPPLTLFDRVLEYDLRAVGLNGVLRTVFRLQS